jgi:hypothetical protein
LLEAGLVEKTNEGEMIVSFGEIHADFLLRGRAA